MRKLVIWAFLLCSSAIEKRKAQNWRMLSLIQQWLSSQPDTESFNGYVDSQQAMKVWTKEAKVANKRHITNVDSSSDKHMICYDYNYQQQASSNNCTANWRWQIRENTVQRSNLCSRKQYIFTLSDDECDGKSVHPKNHCWNKVHGNGWYLILLSVLSKSRRATAVILAITVVHEQKYFELPRIQVIHQLAGRASK